MLQFLIWVFKYLFNDTQQLEISCVNAWDVGPTRASENAEIWRNERPFLLHSLSDFTPVFLLAPPLLLPCYTALCCMVCTAHLDREPICRSDDRNEEQSRCWCIRSECFPSIILKDYYNLQLIIPCSLSGTWINVKNQSLIGTLRIYQILAGLQHKRYIFRWHFLTFFSFAAFPRFHCACYNITFFNCTDKV